MAFPMADLEALIASGKAAVVDILDVMKHAKAIFEWAGISIPFFAGPGGLKATSCSDPIADVQKIVDLHKNSSVGMTLSPDWITAIIALLQMILDRWLHPTPAPTP